MIEAAHLAALLLGSGYSDRVVIDLNDGLSRYREEMDMLSTVIAFDDRPRDRMGFRHDRPTHRGRVIGRMFNGLPYDVTHTDNPKPISKRKARRLRGKGRAA